jgi:hypothetical protein
VFASVGPSQYAAPDHRRILRSCGDERGRGEEPDEYEGVGCHAQTIGPGRPDPQQDDGHGPARSPFAGRREAPIGVVDFAAGQGWIEDADQVEVPLHGGSRVRVPDDGNKQYSYSADRIVDNKVISG